MKLVGKTKMVNDEFQADLAELQQAVELVQICGPQQLLEKARGLVAKYREDMALGTTVEMLKAELHSKLSSDVRDTPWYSNCGGEIFVDNGICEHLRIGHFQGDATVAEFVVAAHEAARAAVIKNT